MSLFVDFADTELVVDGIFSTLFVYSDSKSLIAVESLVKKLLERASNLQDLKYFLGNLRKATIANLKALGSTTYEPRIILLRWHCIFFETSLSLVAGETAALSLLISNQSALLNSFVDAPKKIRNHVFRRFVASLKVHHHHYFIDIIAIFLHHARNLMSFNCTSNKYWRRNPPLPTLF